MKDKTFLLWVSLILLTGYTFAQAAGSGAPLGCPSPKIVLSVANSGSLAYNEASTLQLVVKNTGNADATIEKVSANIDTGLVSCASYVVKTGGQNECQISLTPKLEQGLSLQVDYDYDSCGRTRTGQAQIHVMESQTLNPSVSNQVYAIYIHGGCENSYYACSAPDNSGTYSVGYECYDKDNTYYSPAKERIDLRFDLPHLTSNTVSAAILKLYVSSANKAQEVALYGMTDSWNPVTCSAGGDICTQPYCSECQTLFDSSGNLIASQTISSVGEVSFDVTDAVNKAYSSGEKSLSLQLRGAEDVWDTAGQASCDKPYAWFQQGIEFYGGANEPYIVLSTLVKGTNQSGASSGVCTDCCRVGDMSCTVICDEGTRNFDGSPAITNCQYDGSSVIVWRGTSSQTQNCANGQCSGSVTTTFGPGTTTLSPTTTAPGPTTTQPSSSDICVNCCLPGDMDCTVVCQGGTNTISGSPAITNCQYDGQTVTIWRGSSSQTSSCVNGQCAGSVTTTLSPYTTTTTLPSPTAACIDGTPVGQCSTWMDNLRCVDDPTFGPTLDYDSTCSSSPTPTPYPTSIPYPTPSEPYPTPSMPDNMSDMCFGTPLGQCFTWFGCFRCTTDPYMGDILEYDQSCCSGSSTTITSTTMSPTTTQPSSSDICVNCCLPGDMDCTVVCQSGTNTISGSPAITNCQYDGQTVTIWRGSSSQTSSCVNGHCSGSSSTTSPVSTTSPTTSIVTTTVSPTTTQPTPSGDICVNCCLPGDMSCTVVCQGGTNTISGSPAITNCRYDGQTIFITRGSSTQQSSCVNGHCSGSVTTTSGPGTTTLSPTTTAPAPTTTQPSPSGDICVNCCLAGDMSCTVVCQSGTNTISGSPAITNCQYDGQTITIWRGSSSQTSSCVNGHCSGSVTTSNPGTTTTTTSQTTTTSATTTTTLSSCVPAYDPGKWNNNPRALNCNNCYNYGCNKETDNFAQPGYAHGYSVSMECSSVIQGANADGLMYLGQTDGPCTGCTHKVALVVAPGTDFHWYRQDNTGYWSHKPGSDPVRNVDESGQIISSPETADRGMYTSFCGYFCVNENTINIEGPNSCPY